MNDSETNHVDANDPEISDNLHRIVPDDLSPAGLVAGARGKRRRRKSVVGAVAALALVAFAVPVALNLPTNDSLVAEPAITSTAPRSEQTETGQVRPGAEACYNEDGTPVSHSQEASDPAELGAVRAWLCGDYSPETGAGSVGPIEPLTSGLDALIEGVQSAPEVDLAVISCPAEYILSFNVIFEYEDGSRSVIGGDRHGCLLTYDGGVPRQGGEEFYGEAVSAWETQRETDEGDWVVPHMCPGPLSLLEMNADDAVQASVCGEKEDGSWAATYLDGDLVEALSEELRASLEGGLLPESSAPEQRVWLTLSNKFTDYKTLVRHGDGMYRTHDAEGQESLWEPSVELSTELDEALAAAGATDGPAVGQPVGSPGVEEPALPAEPGGVADGPQPFVSAGCEGLTSEDALSTELPNKTLPDGAERLWLCAGVGFDTGIASPLEPLEDPAAVQQAVAAFNNLGPLPADIACTMELGSSYLVVHEYGDGTRYVVEQREYGCWEAVAGDTVKESNEFYTQTLVDLWTQQRSTQTIDQSRPGPLCALNSSWIAVDPENTTFTSGVACLAGSEADVAPGVMEENPVPDEVLELINGQLETVRPTPEFGGTSGDALVLSNSSGDLLRLFRLDDGSYFWDDGEAMNPWIPEGEIAVALEALFEE